MLLADKDIIYPADPVSTVSEIILSLFIESSAQPMREREIMSLHAEIIALRDRYGITYKDAAHRLYMAECEKIRTDDRAKKAFSFLAKRTRESISNIRNKFKEINETLEGQDD